MKRLVLLLCLAGCASTPPESEGFSDVAASYRALAEVGMKRASPVTLDALRSQGWSDLSYSAAATNFEEVAEKGSIDWLHASELRLYAGGRENAFLGARDAWNWLEATKGGTTGSPELRRIAVALYNHNVALYASLVNWKKPIPIELVNIRRVRLRREGYAREPWTELRPTYTESTKEFPARIATKGVGGPLFAILPDTQERRSKYPYLYPGPYAMPLTAMLRFETNRATLVLHDPQATPSVDWFGTPTPLRADYAAAWAYSMRNRPIDIVAMSKTGSHQPKAGTEHMYALQLPREDRRVLLFVHGLNSSPRAFTQLAIRLMRDPRIRTNYQFIAYQYDTGHPLMINNILFRHRLRRFYDWFQEAAPKAYGMGTVAIGHSMGGLQIKPLAQRSDFQLWDRVFTVRPDQLDLDTQAGRIARLGLIFEPMPEIRRLVFLAVPHQGSGMARGIIGAIGKSSIRTDPRVDQLRRSVVDKYGDQLRPEIKAELLAKHTSVDSLSPGDFYLSGIGRLRIEVPYHSLIGDKNGSTTNPTSDTVVPYESAHLDGAASEKIMRWAHNLAAAPEAEKEVRRILLLHLEQERSSGTSSGTSSGSSSGK
ncbi:MAG: hypothetical protein AAGD14_02095 [Planctomycetota bacterium]